MALRVTQNHVAILGDEPAGFDGTGLLRVTQNHVAVLGDEPAGFDGDGNLRMTQMHVSVVADAPAGFDGDGALRMTQTHVCVLASVPPESASDTISLTEVATAFLSSYNAAEDTIAITETEAGYGPYTFDEVAFDTIALSEVAEGGIPYDVISEDTIDLTESAVSLKVITLQAEDTISLTEGATANRDYIVFATDLITIVETASVFDGTVRASDTIGLVETASAQLQANKSAADTISIREAASYILIRGKVDELYSPFVGGSSDPNAPEPPSTTVPTLTPGSVLLEFPFDTPTTTLTLRRPLLGNRDRLSNQRINRTTRGNKLIIFADNQWPKVHTLVMDFSPISEDEGQDYLDFVSESLGKEIKLTDWEGRAWRGLITNPSDPMTRDSYCNNTISLTFEGELV